jgi:arylsulfatase A-like enzyme
LWEETVFIVLGDHGDNLTEHGIYFSHSGLYDNTLHVPMVMHLPGFEKNEVNTLSQHTDIIPTLFDYLKIEADQIFDGKSLIPSIKENIPIRDKIYAFDGLCNDIRAVRTEKRKIILAKDNFCNLCKASHHKDIEEYDLEKDPEEKNNIYSGESDLLKDIC